MGGWRGSLYYITDVSISGIVMDLNSTTRPDANAGSTVIILIPELGDMSTPKP
jgi:hypothetical protein